MKKEFIFCYTISGEGYSDPTFIAFADKTQALKKLHDEIFELTGKVEHSIKKVDFNFEIGEQDYHRLRIIEVKEAPYHLIHYTEPNEVIIIHSDDNKAHMLDYMQTEIQGSNVWDKDEDQYESGNSYGAHTDDGYVHYEIVSATQVLVEVLEEELERSDIIDALENYEGSEFVVTDELIDFIRNIKK